MSPDELTGLPPARLPFPVTRALPEPVELRAEPTDEGIGWLAGRFSTFNDWYEVDSYVEGHFMERVAPSAFKKTVAESMAAMRILYDHGGDPSIGNKVLAPIRDLTPDARYGGPLFDTSYNRDLLPGLKAGVYGSSFRFTVEKDQWDRSPERSAWNPEGIPERTITEARVFEFGPVTFPANPKATAGARSTTDDFYRRSRDPEQYGALLRSAATARTPSRDGAADRADEPPAPTPDPEPVAASTPAPVEPVAPVTPPTRHKPKPISREDFLAQLRQE